MIHRSESVLPLMVMVTILYAGVVVSMGNLYHSLAVIPTTKSMIRCDALSMLSRRFSSSDYHSPNFENRLHYGCVIDSTIDVSILRQIPQTKTWDPGLSILELGDGAVKSRSDHIGHKSSAEPFNTIGVFFYSALVVARGAFLLSWFLFRSIFFIRLVAVMVLVFTSVTTNHHLHFSSLSDPSQILSDLICSCRPARKPSWNYWAEMAFEKAMGMIPHLQEGVRRRHNTSSRSSFLFQQEADVLTMTSKSRQQLKVMLKAFWSLSYMLLAINIKYMKGGPISHCLIARKAYVQQAGLTHSIIEATASHICENRLYPSSFSLLYERICVSNLVYSNDVLFCY